jgi:hypothetical protein
VILSRSHKDQSTSFSSNRVVISKIIILLTHSVSYYELCPYPRTRLSIDYIHSAEVSTLYPHHGTHGLVLPFGWTNDVPTKPNLLHGTLPATPTNSPLGYVMGDPVSFRHLPSSWPNKTVPNGDRAQNQTWVHKASAAYLIRVALPHNLPWLEAPARGMTIDQVRAVPYQQVWLHW